MYTSVFIPFLEINFVCKLCNMRFSSFLNVKQAPYLEFKISQVKQADF